MTKISFLLIITLMAGCNQADKGSPAKQDQATDSSDSYRITRPSDFRIVDSLTDDLNKNVHHEAYHLIPDTAYFFDQPDAATQRKDYAVKGRMANMLDSAKGFRLVTYPLPNGKYAVGWLKLSDLEKILFTPPRVIKD